MLVNAAIRFNDKIYTGWRHAYIISEIVKDNPGVAVHVDHDDQGFVDENGQFYRRGAAAMHAMKCGQVTKLKWPSKIYSEELWDMYGEPIINSGE